MKYDSMNIEFSFVAVSLRFLFERCHIVIKIRHTSHDDDDRRDDTKQKGRAIAMLTP